MERKRIDARIEAEKLLELYKSDPRQQSFNALVLGDKGTGKTSLLRTARRPVHVDSFDPGGMIVLKDLIESGDVVADVRYENENPLEPIMYQQWLHYLNDRIASGYFNDFGTYCLDNALPWGDAILYWVQRTIDNTKNHAGETPKWNRDYRPQRTQVENCIRKLLALPCDVIVTAHLTGHYENQMNAGGEIEPVLTKYVFNGVGETKYKVPTFFSEMWITQVEDKVKGAEYKLLTQNDGLYRASTRLGSGGKFAKWEKPDIKYLLRKAGWPSEDKPRLTDIGRAPAETAGDSSNSRSRN